MPGPAKAPIGPPWLGGLLLIVGWAVGLRLVGAAEVMARTPFIPPGSDGDAAYHLVRIARSAEHFPWMPLFDPHLNWPQGGVAPWAPGFDWLGALLVVLGGGASSPTEAAVLAGVLPVLLAVAALVVLAVLPMLASDAPEAPAAGLFAAALLAGSPEFVEISLYGRTDHHQAEVLIVLLLIAWAVSTSLQVRRLWFEAGGFAVLAFTTFVYHIGTLYVGLAVAIVIGLSAWRAQRSGERAALGAPALALSAVFTWALYHPFVALTGAPFDTVYPSYLHGCLLALGAVGCALAPWLTLPRVRWGFGLALGLGLAIVLTRFGDPLRDLLLKPEPWLANIQEVEPFNAFAVWWGPSREVAAARFGALGMPLPALLVLGPLLLVRRHPKSALVLGLWTLVIAGLCLSQGRFTRLLAANLALDGAIVLVALTQAFPGGRAGRMLGYTLATALAVTSNATWVLAPAPPLDADAEVSAFLATVEGEPGAGPGVLSWWDRGHIIEWASRRPTVVGNFGALVGGDTFAQQHDAMYAGDAETLRSFMKTRRAGWLVTGLADFRKVQTPPPPAAFALTPAGTYTPVIDFLRDHPVGRTMVGGSGVPEQGVRHLEGFMPVFASRAVVPQTAFPLPSLWVFELVPGATVEGVAAPGAQVLASIDLQLPHMTLPYRTFTVADGRGAFRLLLPVPSGLTTRSLSTGQAWALRWEGGSARLAVPIDAVRTGALVRVPGKDAMLANP